MGHAVALVYDEGPGAGLGHRRRMETLALALHQRDRTCRLAALDPAARIAAPTVVVDSYRFDADRERVDADLLVAVDDLARDLAVDVLVDPSPGAEAQRHSRAQTVLAGAEYALVAPPSPRVPVVPAAGPVERILVTTGAADSHGAGAAIATALRARLGDVQVRLVIGQWGSGDVPDGVVPVHAPASLADELAAAPVVVTAGGVSMLEACLLARATVAVVLAENQRVAAESLTRAGAVRGATLETVADAVAALVEDAPARRDLATAAGASLDGRGANRVAEALLQRGSAK